MTKREQKARDRVHDAVGAMMAVADGMEKWTSAGWVSDATTAHDLFVRALTAYRRAIIAERQRARREGA